MNENHANLRGPGMSENQPKKAKEFTLSVRLRTLCGLGAIVALLGLLAWQRGWGTSDPAADRRNMFNAQVAKSKESRDRQAQLVQARTERAKKNDLFARTLAKQGKTDKPSPENSPWNKYSPVAPPKFDEVTGGKSDEYKFTKLADLAGHSGAIKCIAVTPDATRAVSCDDRSKLIFWDLAKRSSISEQDIANHGEVREIVISPDSKVALVVAEKNLITKWELETGKNTGKLELADEVFQCVGFSPDPNIAATLHGKALSFFDVGTMEIIGMFNTARR